jgi:hypothetical protein
MHRSIYLSVLLSLSLIISSCAVTTTGSKKLGTIRESPEITKKYRSLTIDSDYNYFYSGTELQPNAIMGIDKTYTVQSKFWHQVELTEEQLEYWVKWGDRQSSDEGFSTRYLGRYQGAYIVDPQGQVIGDWYSKKDQGIFEFPGSNVVIPYPPRNRAGSDYYRF